MSVRESIPLARRLGIGFDDALLLVESELALEGFGVLTRIDMRETLQKKLGVTMQRYCILGACNPPLAHRALTAEPMVGLFLPCNVIVYETDDGGTMVAAVDPTQFAAARDNAAVAQVAAEVREKLERVIQRIPA